MLLTLNIIALIDDASVIERILRHRTVWDRQPETRSFSSGSGIQRRFRSPGLNDAIDFPILDFTELGELICQYHYVKYLH